MKIYLFVFLIFLFSSSLQAQKLSSIGIFDATVDLETEEFLPKQDVKNTFGWVDMIQSNGDKEYNIYGNGSSLLPNPPGGLYVYSNRSGSLNLTAKLEMIEAGGKYPVVGLMIRDGISYRSRCFFLSLHFNRHESNLRVNAGATRIEGGDHTYFIGETFPKKFDGAYLRVTRIESENLCIGEWSTDGIHWSFLKEIEMDLPNTLQYGIIVSNDEKNQLLAHAKATDVKIEPAPSLFVSRILPGFYFPGKPLSVSLEVKNNLNHSVPVTINEFIPKRWQVIEAGQDGAYDQQSITWTSYAKPGVTRLTYNTLPSDSDTRSTNLTGNFGNREIFGEWFIKKGVKGLPGSLQPNWRFWKSSDGMFSSISEISISAQGNAIIKRENEDQFVYLDGYSVSYFPDQNRSLPIESDAGDIWSVSKALDENTRQWKSTALQKYEYDNWKSYNVDNLPNNYLKPAIIPITNNELLIIFPDRVLQYNAQTKASKIIKNITDTELGKFFPESQHNQLNFGNPWVFGQNGLAKLTVSTDSLNHSQISWDEFPYDPKMRLLTIHMGPYYNESGEVYFSYIDSTYHPHICKFYDNQWEVLYEGLGGQVTVDSVGNIWLLDNVMKKNLYLIEPYKQTDSGMNLFFMGQTVDIGHDKSGDLWVATLDGLARHTLPLWTSPVKISGLNIPVYSIYEDEFNHIWFASTEYLINWDQEDWLLRYYYATTVVETSSIHRYKISRHANRTMTVAAVNTLTGPVGTFPIHFNPLKQDFIIDYDIPGQVCVGLFPGKYQKQWEVYRDHDSQSFTVYSNKDSKRKLVLELPGEPQLKSIPNVLMEEENGSLWLGLDRTICKYHSGQWEYFGVDEGYNGRNPLVLMDMTNGKKWLGTQEAIYEFNGNVWSIVKDEFSQIYDIIKDSKDRIWIATGDGVYCYNEGSWIQMDTEEGLPSSLVYTIYEDSQERIWAGTASGISMYHPVHDTDPPETVIPSETNIDEFATDEIQMNYKGIDRWKFTQKERLLFSTKLDDQDWSPFINSTNYSSRGVSTGIHKFHVRAMDRNFNIDPSPAQFTFQVLPVPLQQRIWFLPVVYSVMILILTLALFLYRARYKLSKYAVNLEGVVKQQTEEILNTERHLLRVAESEQQRIGQELHDEVVQDLVGVAINSEMLHKKLEPLAQDQAEELHEIIKRMDQSIDKTRKMAKGLSPVDIGENGLEGSLQSLFSHILSMYHIPCSVVGSWETSQMDSETILNTYRIIQEAVTNAAKHSHSKEITVYMHEEYNNWSMNIIDEGLGINLSNSESTGMGLHIMKYRAHQIGAELHIKSLCNQGTQIQCYIPKKYPLQSM